MGRREEDASWKRPLFRIVFLDVDGVLHPASRTAGEEQPSTFVARSMEALSKIIRATSAKIVLSSSWRQSPAKISIVNEALQKWGMPGVWQCTPTTPCNSRSEEIDAWLRAYLLSGAEPIDGMVAIDDEDLSTQQDRYGFPTPSRIKPYSLRTPASSGLSSPHVLRAVNILQRTAQLWPWAGVDLCGPGPGVHIKDMSILRHTEDARSSLSASLGPRRDSSEPRRGRTADTLRRLPRKFSECGLQSAVLDAARAAALPSRARWTAV